MSSYTTIKNDSETEETDETSHKQSNSHFKRIHFDQCQEAYAGLLEFCMFSEAENYTLIDDDETANHKYQDLFIRFLYLDAYEDQTVMPKINMIYNICMKYKQFNTIFELIKTNRKQYIFSDEHDVLFMLLFSFDFFYYLHQCLIDLVKYGKFMNDSYSALVNAIQK